MKTKIVTVTVAAIVMTITTVFGQEPDKKAEKARKDANEAKQDLKLAKVDSTADYQAFKKEAEQKIATNDMKIAELKKDKAAENKETKEKYQKKVTALEVKNNNLKKKMNGADKTETAMWTSFKREFNHDMSELGNAFRDIGIDNKK